MEFDLEQLVGYLHVEQQTDTRFVGHNLPGKRRAVFGGQIIAQALSAAAQTVDTQRLPHSLHCHFLRPGNIELAIDYQVAIVRDGGSFSLRQVTAQQAGKVIFMVTISFQTREMGVSHQQKPPVMVPREEMISEFAFWQQAKEELPELNYLRPNNFTALDILSKFRPGIQNPQPQEPHQSFWFRANGTLDDAIDHRLVLAFQSDLLLLNTAFHAHPYTLMNPQVQAASLDHSLWFNNDIDVCQWLYYDMYSPVSHGGRGLNHGYLYTESGQLIATTTQEGLMRVNGVDKKQ